MVFSLENVNNIKIYSHNEEFHSKLSILEQLYLILESMYNNTIFLRNEKGELLPISLSSIFTWGGRRISISKDRDFKYIIRRYTSTHDYEYNVTNIDETLYLFTDLSQGRTEQFAIGKFDIMYTYPFIPKSESALKGGIWTEDDYIAYEEYLSS